MSAPNLKFKRVLHFGDKGDDVLAVKIAIARAGFWPWKEFDEIYHEEFGKGNKLPTRRIHQGVNGFKRHVGLNTNGIYDEKTHEALLNAKVPKGKTHEGEFVFDGRARALYRGFEDVSDQENIVKAIYAAWYELLAHKNDIHYNENIRPIVPLAKRQNPPRYPTILDCSGTVIYTCWLAGARSPDPINGYNGYGYTGSLIQGGFYIAKEDVTKYSKDHLVLAFYGSSRYNTKHVTSIKSMTENFSNGSELAPEIINTPFYRSDFIEFRAYKVI